LEKGSVSIQVREVRKVDKGRRKISVLLSFISFSKLVILIYTGQPVKNNTAYTCYIITSFHLRTYNPKFRRLVKSTRSPEGSFRAPKVQKSRRLVKSTQSPEDLLRAPEVQKACLEHPRSRRLVEST
jgi:hypothetical protein